MRACRARYPPRRAGCRLARCDSHDDNAACDDGAGQRVQSGALMAAERYIRALPLRLLRSLRPCDFPPGPAAVGRCRIARRAGLATASGRASPPRS